jgi:hypothetical protein
LTQDDAWTVISSYFEEKVDPFLSSFLLSFSPLTPAFGGVGPAAQGLVRQQLDSFDEFIHNTMQEVIEEANPTDVYPEPKLPAPGSWVPPPTAPERCTFRVLSGDSSSSSSSAGQVVCDAPKFQGDLFCGGNFCAKNQSAAAREHRGYSAERAKHALEVATVSRLLLLLLLLLPLLLLLLLLQLSSYPLFPSVFSHPPLPFTGHRTSRNS